MVDNQGNQGATEAWVLEGSMTQIENSKVLDNQEKYAG